MSTLIRKPPTPKPVSPAGAKKKHASPVKKAAPLTEEARKEEQRRRQAKAWERISKAAAKGNTSVQSITVPKRIAAAVKAKAAPGKPAASPRTTGSPAASGQTGKFDPCWICGETTHGRKECPNRIEGHLQRKQICLGCRKRGHVLADCPSVIPSARGAGAPAGGAAAAAAPVRCFNCGEDGHPSRSCPRPLLGDGASYASCFVCGAVGHLSAKCPKNAKGVYPRGGSCKVCGEVTHKADDCPKDTAGPKQKEGKRAAPQEDEEEEKEREVEEEPKKKKRVKDVKF